MAKKGKENGEFYGLMVLMRIYEDIIPIFTRGILTYDQDRHKFLTDFIKYYEQNPGQVSLDIEALFIGLRASFHPFVLEVYSRKRLDDFFTNPWIFALDFLLWTVREDQGAIQVSDRHRFLLQCYTALKFARSGYQKKLESQKYGKEIVRSMFVKTLQSDPTHPNPIHQLIKMIRASKKNYNLAQRLDNLSLPGESESVIGEEIACCIKKREDQAKSLGEYLPPEIPAKIRRAISSNRKNAKMAQNLSDAVNGHYRVLKVEVPSRLRDEIKKMKAEKRSGAKFVHMFQIKCPFCNIVFGAKEKANVMCPRCFEELPTPEILSSKDKIEGSLIKESLNTNFAIERENSEGDSIEEIPSKLSNSMVQLEQGLGFSKLTESDREFLVGASMGETQSEQAKILNINEKTLRKRKKSIEEKTIPPYRKRKKSNKKNNLS